MRSRFRPILVSAIAAAACALIAAGVASAAGAGSLDTSFGSNGIVVDQWGQSASPSSDANQAVFQSDGSIVVAGEASTSSSGYQAIIARYTNSGSHDNGFGPLSGVAGAAAVSFGSGNAHGVGVALDNPSAPSSTEYWLAGDFQPSGGGEDFALAKVKHDGSGLDTSFGINGIVTTAPSAFGANITNVQPVAIYHYTSGANTGDTLIVGTAGVSGGESDFAIARYTSSGTGSGLDTTFNPTGPVPGTELISFDGGSVTSSSATATATFVDPTSGVIVVVGGIVGTGISAPQMAAARLKADGGLDTTFQTNGFGHYPVGSATAPGATALAIDSDGSGGYILGGHAVDSSGNQDFALLHLDSTGAPVTSWQSGGSELSTPSQLGTPASIQSLRVSGGDIIAAGYATPSATNTDFAIARYTLSSGAPDTTFGTNGFTTTAIAGSGEFAQALSLAVDPSTGNYLAAGYAVPNGGNTLLAMARYLASGSGGGNNYQVTSVNANPPSLQAGSNTASTITAKVTNNGSAVSGVQVDFTVSGIGCGANPASATTANGQGGTTLGQASTTYTVGTGTGSCTVTATVHGTSASNATSVNQTAPPPSYQISVGANPSSLPAGSGQSSFVTATVTNNGSNVSGDTVYFAVHGTGCGTLSSPDGSGQPKGSTINGQVKITYQVGSTPGNCTITAQETNTGATGSTTITQTGDLPDASLPGAILGDYNATTNSYALVLYDQLSPHGTPTCVDFQLFSSSGQLIYQSAPQGPDSSNGNPDTLVSKTIVPVGLKFAVLVHYWTPNSGGCSSGTDYDTARVYFTIPGPPPSASLVG